MLAPQEQAAQQLGLSCDAQKGASSSCGCLLNVLGPARVLNGLNLFLPEHLAIFCCAKSSRLLQSVRIAC